MDFAQLPSSGGHTTSLHPNGRGGQLQPGARGIFGVRIGVIAREEYTRIAQVFLEGSLTGQKRDSFLFFPLIFFFDHRCHVFGVLGSFGSADTTEEVTEESLMTLGLSSRLSSHLQIERSMMMILLNCAEPLALSAGYASTKNIRVGALLDD